MEDDDELPQEVVDAIFDEGIIKAAWNAQFERTCLSRYFGIQLSPDSWQCSMVWAASLSLPLALKNAAAVLKTGEQKDKAGEALIRYFSIPCKPTKKNGGRTRNLPEHDPEGWQTFKDYCLQDVRTERDIRHRLEVFPLKDSEWDYYHMDQRINDRGVMIDKELVEQAITCDLLMSEEMTQRWAGRGIQLQNLPQNHITTLDEARELLKMGAFDALEMVYGYDSDVTLIFQLYASEGILDIPQSGVDAKIRGTKRDGNGISADATFSYVDSIPTVSVRVTKQMTAIAGKNYFELLLKAAAGVGSLDFLS